MAIILNLETNIINRNHYCWSLGLALGLGSTVQAVDRFAEAVAGDVEGALLHLVGQARRDAHRPVKRGVQILSLIHI